MGKQCSGYGCNNRDTDKVPGRRFHRFPLKDPRLLEKWVKAISRKDWQPASHSRMCSEHFTEMNYTEPKKVGKLLPNAVPSIFSSFPSYMQPQQRSERVGPKKRCIGNISTASSTEECEVVTTSSSSGLDHPYCSTTEISAGELAAKEKVASLTQKLRAAEKRLQRRDNKIANLNELFSDLGARHLLEKDAVDMMSQYFQGMTLTLFENEAKNHNRAKKGHRYSDSFKEFALTLHYYSPQAYDYCRSVLQLPDPSSLRNWLLNAKVETGFLQKVLLSLQNKPAVEQDCALIIDSMSLRKQTVYNSVTGRYDGFVDYGPAGLVAEQTDVTASESLVFLLVSLHSNWKVPIAFFYVDKVQSAIQRQLVTTALEITADHGIRVRCLTFDGAAANISMANALGCSIGTSDSLVSHFRHPTLDNPVYIILDICHMLKLARNALAELGTLKNSTGDPIRWHYIQRLVEIQQEEGLHLANKLTNTHIQWYRLKMKVKLAAQTLSKSVADALQFLATFHPDFQNVDATIEFIRHIDMGFDILNSRSSFGKGNKSALRLSNLQIWESNLNQVSEYLAGIRSAEGQLLSTHRRRTFILGFRSSIKSIIALSKDLLTREHHPFDYVLTFRMSQDHIECLFSKIRSMGGFNNNPNVVQFKAALRKLLVKQQISSSPAANCADSDISGAVFELKWSRRTTPLQEDRFQPTAEEDVLDVFSVLDSELSTVKANIVYYMAGYVIRRLSPDITCINCVELLKSDSFPKSLSLEHHYTSNAASDVERSVSELVRVKDRGGLLHPTKALYDILTTAEKTFKALTHNKKLESSFTLARLRNITLRTLHDININFPRVEHDQPLALGEAPHEYSLTYKVLTLFFKIRLHHHGKVYTSDVIHKKVASNRNQSARLTIFSHR